MRLARLPVTDRDLGGALNGPHVAVQLDSEHGGVHVHRLPGIDAADRDSLPTDHDRALVADPPLHPHATARPC